MTRWLILVGALAAAGALAQPAFAGWRLRAVHRAPIVYNQGIAFDRAAGEFWFDGATGASNSGLFRTGASLRPIRGRIAVLPPTRQRYNHAGDLSFDALRRRVLLPLECFNPYTRRNPCGTAAIGVVDPRTLAFLYYVNLDRAQIAKAMWAEISPDGRWIWTSSAAHLLVYSAASVNRATADRQRAGSAGGIVGKDLGAVLPATGVTGAGFSQLRGGTTQRLFLALNRRTYFQVVSYAVGRAPDGSPTIAAGPRPEISLRRSPRNHESEGLALTAGRAGAYPLGGALHWQVLPYAASYVRILSYVPA